MTAAAPCFSEAAAAEVLSRHFGVAGVVTPVASERDQNFHVAATSGQQFVLKIANSAEDRGVTDLQNKALRHIGQSDPDFSVPRLYPALNGDDSISAVADDAREHVVRVLSWLEGASLQHATGAHEVAAPLGRCLARLDLALQDFEHPSSDYSLLWDIKRASSLAGLLDNIGDASLRNTCAGLLQRFTKTIEPALRELRWQVIHNDLNPSNVLVAADDAKVLAGVIDFGDVVRSPLIADVAVATAYLCHATDEPFSDVIQFLAAYTQDLPLLQQEVELLGDLILMRKVLTVLIANWRAARYPDNRDYILRNEAKARATIMRIDALSRQSVAELFLNACNN